MDGSSPESRDRLAPWAACRSFPKGVQEQFVRSAELFAYRFWIVDNSGSMGVVDGTRLVRTRVGKLRKARCSRWSELQETVRFHAEAAAALRAPTEFVILNAQRREDQSTLVGGGNVAAGVAAAAAATAELDAVDDMLDENSPGGRTPLCRHIIKIADKIRAMTPALRQRNQRVTVVIATDGEATDGEVAEALRQLRGLPVWVVVRLCTDEDHVVHYWNEIDADVELDMDVLDDWGSEAREIVRHNRWITYGLPLHRLREFGTSFKVFDLVEEKRLAPTEIRDYCATLFGVRKSQLPEPDIDWAGFLASIRDIQARTEPSSTTNPITGAEEQWVALPSTLAALRRGRRGAKNPAQGGGCFSSPHADGSPSLCAIM